MEEHESLVAGASERAGDAAGSDTKSQQKKEVKEPVG